MAGTITHSWKGTVLTITSDAGTSSADLAGATGCRGPQGRPGVVYDNAGKMIVSDLASLDYVDAELKKFDKKTLIRDEDGNLSTAVGGYIIKKTESEFIAGLDNTVCSAVLSDIYFVVSGIDFTLLTKDEYYDIHITLGDGTEIDLKNIQYQTTNFQSITDSEYVTGTKFSVGGAKDYFIIQPTDIGFWTGNALAVARFEISTHGYCVYSPIDARAIPIDGETLVVNKTNQLTTGANVATHDYVAGVRTDIEGWVDEQISLAQLGGDVAVLDNYYTKLEAQDYINTILAIHFANYYTKSEVDALVESAGGTIPSSEEVDY